MHLHVDGAVPLPEPRTAALWGENDEERSDTAQPSHCASSVICLVLMLAEVQN